MKYVWCMMVMMSGLVYSSQNFVQQAFDAIRSKNIESLKDALSHLDSVTINRALNQQGRQLLVQATYQNFVDGVDAILKAGGFPDVADQVSQETPLQRAVMMNQFEIAEMLLKKNADPLLVTGSFFGFSPLELATAKLADDPSKSDPRMYYLLEYYIPGSAKMP